MCRCTVDHGRALRNPCRPRWILSYLPLHGCVGAPQVRSLSPVGTYNKQGGVGARRCESNRRRIHTVTNQHTAKSGIMFHVLQEIAPRKQAAPTYVLHKHGNTL